MKHTKLVIIVSIFLLLLSSCKTQLNTTKLTESYLPLEVDHKLSTMAVTVDLDIPELEKTVNNNLKGILYEDSKFEDDNLMMKVTKTKDFKFAVHGSVITCDLPVSIWVKTGYKKDLLITTAEAYYEATGTLNVNVSIDFSIQKDWSVKTRTTINKHTWIKAPTIKTSVVDIPVTTLADIAIKALKAKMTAAVDNAIAEDTYLRETMLQTWKDFQAPFLVDKDYDLWLKITPQSIFSTPIAGTGNNLLLNLGLTGIIETNMGNNYFPPTTPVALPEYKVVKTMKPDFSIHSNITVSYHKMEEIANTMMVGQEFSQGKKKIKIEGIHIYGQDDLLVAQVAISGSVNGSIFCTGKPTFDNATQSIKISHFDFAVDTKSVLLKSANWLMHKSFLKLIEPMLTISMKAEIADMLNTANSTLKNYEIQKGITLNGSLQNVLIHEISVTRAGLVVGGNTNGNLKVNVGDLY
ncbi:MAG: DUF4403 family protein [Prevotellaceae bacterium]|nr:DUF4403 family protein [Prevotellaceae bacterium]